MSHSTEKTANYKTLTFINSRKLNLEDLKSVFEKYAPCVRIRQVHNRVFVAYRTVEDASYVKENCREYELTYASYRSGGNSERPSSDDDRKAGNSTNRKESNSSGKQSCSNFQTVFPKSKNLHPESAQDYKSVKDSHKKNEEQSSKDVPKIYPLVLANLPDSYTLDNIYSLIEEADPFQFSKIDVTNGLNIKFCVVYFELFSNVAYVKQKLNKFIISGRKLITVEPSEMISW